MPQIHNPEWPDQHRATAYPFSESATLRSSTGDLTLDKRWFTEARLWPATSDARVYIRSIARTANTLTVTLASTNAVLGVGTLDMGSTKRRVVFFSPEMVQIGYIESSVPGWTFMADELEGVYRFSAGSTEFVATVVTPQPVKGVNALRDGEGTLLVSDWRFVGGEGIELVATATGFRVDIIGDELYRRDTCELPEELGLLLNPVREIHWLDTRTGVSGVAQPKRGQILTAIREQLFAGRRRGHAAPGPDGSLLHQLG